MGVWSFLKQDVIFHEELPKTDNGSPLGKAVTTLHMLPGNGSSILNLFFFFRFQGIKTTQIQVGLH